MFTSDEIVLVMPDFDQHAVMTALGYMMMGQANIGYLASKDEVLKFLQLLDIPFTCEDRSKIDSAKEERPIEKPSVIFNCDTLKSVNTEIIKSTGQKVVENFQSPKHDTLTVQCSTI